MSDTDDYVKAKRQFEKLQLEYWDWVAQANQILNLLHQVDAVRVADRQKVLANPLRLGQESEHTFATTDGPTRRYQSPTRP